MAGYPSGILVGSVALPLKSQQEEMCSVLPASFSFGSLFTFCFGP